MATYKVVAFENKRYELCYKGQIYDCTPNSSDLMHRVFWNHFKNRFVFVCDDCMDEITRLC